MRSSMHAIKAAKHYLRRQRMRRRGIAVQLDIETVVPAAPASEWGIHPGSLNRGSIVYSFGVGNNIAWDLALIDRFGVTVHAFDPTPRSVEWVASQQLPAAFRFHDVGLADIDGVQEFHPPLRDRSLNFSPVDRGERTEPNSVVPLPVHRLCTIMDSLGHDYIDLLKIDIEGGEYAVLQDVLDCDIPVGQLLVEFHHNYSTIPLEHTIEAVKALNYAGYRIFHISDRGYEYSFFGECRHRLEGT